MKLYMMSDSMMITGGGIRMKLEFIGAAHEVTGSCHFIHWQDRSILVDCGMEQGPDIYENQELPVKASDIDYVFVTHAHIDHSGLLPLLAQQGFKGQIFATDATSQLEKGILTAVIIIFIISCNRFFYTDFLF